MRGGSSPASFRGIARIRDRSAPRAWGSSSRLVPRRPGQNEQVIVLGGDGWFSLNVPELASATHRRLLALVFINLNDQRPGRSLAIPTMASLPNQSAVTVNS
jgi:hypothetical protein